MSTFRRKKSYNFDFHEMTHSLIHQTQVLCGIAYNNSFIVLFMVSHTEMRVSCVSQLHVLVTHATD